MNQNTPKISVIMPAFNREKFIGKAIASVLSQSFKNIELIIIDDGSADSTVSIAREYCKDSRVKVLVNEKNLGIAETRNRGLREAQGEYIAMLDSDDVWLDNTKLEKQLAFLETNPAYAIVGSAIKKIDQEDKDIQVIEYPCTDSAIRKTILRYNSFAQSALLIRKSAMMQAGMYSTRFKICDDYDLWLRIGCRSKFTNLKEITTGYRIHGGNITHKKRLTAAKEVLEIVRMHADEYPYPRLGIIKAYARLILAYART